MHTTEPRLSAHDTGSRFAPEGGGQARWPAALSDAQRDAVMRLALIALWLFNLEDYVLTQAALRSGAVESNLLFAFFLDMGPVPALAFKLGIVTAGCVLLWRLRRHPATLVASLGLALAYVLVTVFHLAVSLT